MSGSGTDYTQTANLGLYKPIFNMAVGQWGDLWNSNADKLDSAINAFGGGPFLPLSGGTVTGGLTVHNTSNGPFASPFLYSHGSLSGIAGSAMPQANFAQISIDADSMDTTSNSGPGGATYLWQGATINAGATGNRTGIEAWLNCVGSPGAGPGKFYTAIAGFSFASASDHGQQDSVFGGNLVAQLQPGATGWGGLCGLEIDIDVDAGASVQWKEGFKIVLGSTDAVKGSVIDAAFTLAAAAGINNGWEYGFAIGSPLGIWPIAPDGTIIGTPSTALGGPAYACSFGVNFSSVAFSQAAWVSPGFLINRLGGIACQTANASAASDVSHHIAIGNIGLGFNVYNGNLGAYYGAASFTFNSTSAMDAYINSSGLRVAATLGVWNAAGPGSKPAVTGAKGSNTALASLLTALASYGLITDSTTA